jgi:hypothetical protein
MYGKKFTNNNKKAGRCPAWSFHMRISAGDFCRLFGLVSRGLFHDLAGLDQRRHNIGLKLFFI